MDSNGEKVANAGQDNKDPEKDASVAKMVKYPKVVFFIIGNEFCERFSYYGMRTVLSLFLKNALSLKESNATVIYHVFAMLCYFFPLIGAVIADSWLGKFNTIAYLSVVYAVGNVVVSFASATNIGVPSAQLTYVGLFLIAVGTGGIKPCVSAFGGDQFTLPQQARQLASFFSIFYFAINAGSLISTYITPELRATQCMGLKECFPLAFGVPAILMVLSLVIFVLGKPGYRIMKPKGNVLVEVSKCMWSAWTNRGRGGTAGGASGHWLDRADERFSDELRADIRAVLRVLLLFVPLPVFWALYDQQGSRWTFQANNMNGRIGSWTVKPDQMQVVNPLLILLFLPLFETVVYPTLNKMHLLTKPLQKMATGGVLAAIAFIISGILELQLQAHYPVALSPGLAQVRVFNSLPCAVTLNGSDALPSRALWTRTDIEARGDVVLDLNLSGECLAPGSKLKFVLQEEKSVSYQLYTTDPVTQGVVTVKSRALADNLEKQSDPRIRIVYNFVDDAEHTLKFSLNGEERAKVVMSGIGVQDNVPSLGPAEYTITLDSKKIVANQLLDVGGVYTILVDGVGTEVLTVISPNVIHLMWLLPQYIVITLSEVMFSVTGLEFAFTQAPKSMKSVLTSAWLLTVAFGNLIVVLITEIRFFSSQASEFFLFAGLMLAVLVVFVFLAMRYKYVDTASEASGQQRQMETIAHADKLDT